MRLVGGGIGLDEVDYIDTPYDEVCIYLSGPKVCGCDVETGTERVFAWYDNYDDYYCGSYLAWLATQMLLDAYMDNYKVFVFPRVEQLIQYAEMKNWGRPKDD